MFQFEKRVGEKKQQNKQVYGLDCLIFCIQGYKYNKVSLVILKRALLHIQTKEPSQSLHLHSQIRSFDLIKDLICC